MEKDFENQKNQVKDQVEETKVETNQTKLPGALWTSFGALYVRTSVFSYDIGL